ncbi:hypothetical protein CCO03_06280 [Comamonas serinivorans]|uniref:Glycosyltransferase n=1 Tax=Comamonas serinivorans TaxID=1082851 RepID=A0A1Y0ELL6_9BURK|nr:hypothetical protein [Comamonas serinivorans]ARU04331.1 hypothetical protein CCO03_06280 [Comamonas serinivorans]
MNTSSPVIVAQSAVRRLPRAVLWLLCAAYVALGYLGREPWKAADIASFGFMRELARSPWSDWLQPRLLDVAADAGSGPLPYWLGAIALQWLPFAGWQDLVSRLPFMALLGMTLWGTWYAAYHLARNVGAQPVAFAFGGEAQSTDYARVIADGTLLALLATLGLAQYSHETAAPLVQLTASTAVLYGLAAMPHRPLRGSGVAGLGLVAMSLSGAPWLSLIYGGGGALLLLLAHARTVRNPQPQTRGHGTWLPCAAMSLATLLGALLAVQLDLFTWNLSGNPNHWTSQVRLFIWFLWPAWPFLLWTLWRWRRQLRQLDRHRQLALPLLFMLPAVFTACATASGDRALLLALPALAVLAAFALPTFDRSISALIDWCTLLFFSAWAIVIWVVWLSMMTGFPPKPAANVARLAPGFTPTFSIVATVVAVVATLAWAWLVRWRTKRSRAAIWKSLALPAGGAVLCWCLLMTLWLPALDYARSYAAQIQRLHSVVAGATCLNSYQLRAPQIAAVQYYFEHDHGQPSVLRVFGTDDRCAFTIVNADARAAWAQDPRASAWEQVRAIRRPTDRDDRDEDMLVYRQKVMP